jgi:hypothetical protein
MPLPFLSTADPVGLLMLAGAACAFYILSIGGWRWLTYEARCVESFSYTHTHIHACVAWTTCCAMQCNGDACPVVVYGFASIVQPPVINTK